MTEHTFSLSWVGNNSVRRDLPPPSKPSMKRLEMRMARPTERYFHGPVAGLPGSAGFSRESALRGGGGAPIQRPGPSAIELELDPGPSAAAEARAALAHLDGRADPTALEDIRLLISELVTNSVRHSSAPAGSKLRLLVSTVTGTLRVEVSDAGRGFEPTPRSAPDTEAGGWGLHLVDRLAHRWGVHRGRRATVWFEIDAAAR
ncbi:MAG: serine/threonine-protein kinase RsbW [Thermoleophilaceae bacterium]|nr:serine/threonine-protein kinase RsbW [Thermoleophilaceae bacterium]